MKRRNERGVTLIEITVVTVIVTAVAMAVYGILEDASFISQFVEEHNDLPVYTQQAVNAIQTEVFQARQIFDNTGQGPLYLATITLPAGAPLAPDSLLPVINTTGQIGPDTGTGASRYTGNTLFFARQLTPIQVNLGGGLIANIDVYKFEYFYLTRSSARNFLGQGYYLDLNAVVSETYADYNEIANSGYSTTQMTTICSALRSLPGSPVSNIERWKGKVGPIMKAWVPQAEVASAFYSIPASVTSTTNPLGSPSATPTIAIDASGPLVPAIGNVRISGKMDYSVGFSIPAATVTTLKLKWGAYQDPMPVYAVLDGTYPNFPSGFEVQIIGTPGAREVFTRLLLYANYGRNRLDSHASQAITATSAS